VLFTLVGVFSQVTYEEARRPAASLKKAISSGKAVPASESHKLVAEVESQVSALLQQLSTVGKSPDVKMTPALSSAIEDMRKGEHFCWKVNQKRILDFVQYFSGFGFLRIKR